MGVLEVVGMGLKLTLLLAARLRKAPSDKRRAALSELDKAIDKAKKENDLKDLSQWISKRL